MLYRRAVPPILCAIAALALPAPASAGFPADGKLWRQLTETVGVTQEDVAAMCPRDGVGRCAGAYDGWIWATDAQVIALMGAYSPDLLTAQPPSVGGADHLFAGITFLGDMRPTFFFAGYVDTTGFTSGWTADGHVASAGYTYPYFNGSLGVGSVTDGSADRWRGVWLWRPDDDDLSAPSVTPVPDGTVGDNGWYTSDVRVSWDVSDGQSAAASDCPDASVTTDGTVTLTCRATSAGGTTTGSATIMRDTSPPVVTCDAPPSFELTQFPAAVTATVTDATSGPAIAALSTPVNVGSAGTFSVAVSGRDRAGNSASATCSYRVVVPTCNGRTPTIVGNAANNTINGTAGNDVIVGLGGADTIKGNGGDDTICGGDGNDSLEGGDGNDYLDGGAGSDSLRGDSGKDTCVSGEVRTSSCEA